MPAPESAAVASGQLPLSMPSLRRRFQLLLVLRWVPSGLFVTVFVLLMRDRGLSLAQIGVATATQGLVMLALELPSGGFADAVGRRVTLVIAGVLAVAATGLLVVADSVGVLAVVFAVQGVARALDSGPLQSWFVDASLENDPNTSIERDLSRADVVICASIGGGAILASAIVTVDLGGIDPLVLPILASLVVQTVSLVAVLTLMTERRRTAGWKAGVRAVGEVPAVIHGALRVIRASRLLGALVAAELCWGAGMIAFETFFPPRLAELTAGFDEAASAVGPIITVAWILSALGAACAPTMMAWLGAGPAAFVLRLGQGAAVVGMGIAAGPVGLIVGYLTAYWTHGGSGPVHYSMVHRLVDADHRTTVVSANSLAAQAGAALSGIALGVLADATSIAAAMIVAGAVLIVAAPLYLVRPTGRDVDAESGGDAATREQVGATRA